MANLNKEEYALLSQFSYIDLPNRLVNMLNSTNGKNYGQGLSMEYALKLISSENEFKKYLTDDQVALVHKLQNSPEIGKLKFVQYENKDALIGNRKEFIKEQKGKDITGFVAMGFVSTEGNPIAVYRGSETLAIGNKDSNDDWSDNFAHMLLGKESTQYGQAKDFFDKLQKKGKGKPILVGHSKGGNLGAYIAALVGMCEVYLYNPMPLHKDILTEQNKENLKSSNIHTYIAENDFIATLLSLFSPAEIKILLQELTEEELKQMLDGGLVNFAEFLIGKKGELGLIGKSLSYKIVSGQIDLDDFEGNFKKFLKNYDTYNYPGSVEIMENDSNILDMINSHGTHNFYNGYYPTIDLSLDHSHHELIHKFTKINNMLDKIDRDMNFLLARVVIDFNPFHVVHNLKNGNTVRKTDVMIDRSPLIQNCISWLKEVEVEFEKAERKNVDLSNQIQVPRSKTEVRIAAMFK